jgi:hypothetical protein
LIYRDYEQKRVVEVITLTRVTYCPRDFVLRMVYAGRDREHPHKIT